MMRIRLTMLSLLAVFAVSAVAAASASAFTKEWKVTNACVAHVGGGFEDNKCTKAKVNGGFEKFTGILGAGQSAEVTSEGGTFTLKAATVEIKCLKVTDKGTVKAGGTDEASEILFTECTVVAPTGCKVKSEGGKQKAGEILVKNIQTLLVERETSAKVKVLADEFKGTGLEEVFVTLELGTTEKVEHEKELNEKRTLTGKCTGIGIVNKVTGQVAAKVENATEELNFPSPELKGNNLNAFGVKAVLVGKDKQKLVGGGTLEGV